MPWCPKCRQEYRGGFNRCSECDVDLVEFLEHDIEETEENTNEEVFLVNASDEMQANILVALLESCNIPSLKRFKESDDYLNIYMGRSNGGVDIFVPSSALDEAKRIIASNLQESEIDVELNHSMKKETEYPQIENFDTEYYSQSEDYDKQATVRRVMGWILVIVFMLPLIISAIAYFINMSSFDFMWQ